MKTVRAGVLRHVILIQRLIDSVGSMGQVVHTWANLLDTRAYVKPLTGGEWYITEKIRNEVTHQLVIRDPRNERFTGKDRIIFGSRIFDIVSVLNFEEREMHLIILAKERLDEEYIKLIPTIRITESSDDRITESGDTRILEN